MSRLPIGFYLVEALEPVCWSNSAWTSCHWSSFCVHHQNQSRRNRLWSRIQNCASDELIGWMEQTRVVIRWTIWMLRHAVRGFDVVSCTPVTRSCWQQQQIQVKVLETALQRNGTQLTEQHVFPTWLPCNVLPVVLQWLQLCFWTTPSLPQYIYCLANTHRRRIVLIAVPGLNQTGWEWPVLRKVRSVVKLAVLSWLDARTTV
jgi:hypothetical protein